MTESELKKIKEELEYAKNEWSTLYAYLYYFLAREFVKLGEEGEKALRKGIRNYGQARGNRLKKRHQKIGLPITMQSLFNNYDLPGDTKSKRNQIKLTEDERESFTFVCNLEKEWREIGGKEGDYLGSIYCDEFHQAMWGAYKEGTIVELPELLTKGDSHCHFIVYKEK